MRGCITLLMFIGMLLLPFVVLGYTAAAFIVMAVVFSVLWMLARGFEALGNALSEDDEEEDDEQPRELSE